MNHDAVAVQMCVSAGLTEQQTDELLTRLNGHLRDTQRQLAALQVDAERYRVIAGHMFGAKGTHDPDQENRIRRIQIDIRKTSISSRAWLDNFVDSLKDNIAARAQQGAQS